MITALDTTDYLYENPPDPEPEPEPEIIPEPELEIILEPEPEPEPPKDIILDHLTIVKKYDKEYCRLIVQHCSNGGSVESFAGKEHIDPDVLVEWINKEEEYEDFRASVKIAVAAEYRYWEQKLLDSLKDSDNQWKLPSINRKLGELGNYLLKNGLRQSLYKDFDEEAKINNLIEQEKLKEAEKKKEINETLNTFIQE